MRVNIKKYFWEYNPKATKEVQKILRNAKHPQFITKIYTFLSRCDKPKEVFALIRKKDFIENWPKIRRYWIKRKQAEDFRYWWESIYENLIKKKKIRKVQKGYSWGEFKKIGILLRDKRIEKGYSQKDLAIKVGLKQPDISNIEKGKVNLTLETLIRLCKVLGIKKIILP